ncbi:CAZyme family GH85 [Agaricus bisporus var. burnettii]|uniref:CAZyme family GH85 n=1 Tax=Agaricus bisporus var. burnettii TaxID=192524 RepID=A0A8H7KHQ5_AGABI|nr:CAZyme family GH85 [Agaricus bisporus var. burnettii]
MPTTNLLPAKDQFFQSLAELDAYQTKKQSERPAVSQTTEWTPRKSPALGSRGRLLVCHDYKGGYVEDPQGLSYTFNYWSLCESFVYFSHHRVTIPPPGWVNAAHRQGVKMLGVLIFEGDAQAEALRLIVGKLPQTSGSLQSSAPSTLPISSHYAIALADLAAERGFDGYLLNFECVLTGGVEQARSLAAWITLLQSELVKRVGPHAETVWYDSVIFTGSLAWQNRLNSFNLPFFIPSTSFFSNYSWSPSFTDISVQYYNSLDSQLIGLASDSRSKTLQDVLMGIDVWGRGSYGGGGFGCYKSLNHITPAHLSTALFAQAWTWETRENESDFTWDLWWNYERDLWVGNPDPNAVIPVPSIPTPDEGPYKPLSTFFSRLPPPDPDDVPFHTTFCPGVGRSWFVAGVPVHQYPVGWMDVDKQTTMGDLIWPIPTLTLEGNSEGPLPDVAASVDMTDSWNSGTSIRLLFTDKEINPDHSFRSFSFPIQTLTVTTQKSYTASIIYKLIPDGTTTFELSTALSIVPLQTGDTFTQDQMRAMTCAISPNSVTTTELTNDWVKSTMEFIIADTPPGIVSLDCSIGLTLAITSSQISPFPLTLLLGQLNVHSTPSSTIQPNFPRILWSDFSSSSVQFNDGSTREVTNVNWQPATSLSQVGPITITSPEDPNSAWTPQPPLEKQWWPGFVYFNVYASPPPSPTTSSGISLIQLPNRQHQHLLQLPSDTNPIPGLIWLGTSGPDNSLTKGNFQFSFDRTQLPGELRELPTLRVYVQGILDTGEILDGDSSAFVDVTFPIA